MSTSTHDSPPALSLDQNGRLTALQPTGPVEVTVRPCFPWSAPDRFLSLRDKDHQEVALVPSLDALPAGSAEALRHVLGEIRFTFTLRAIREIEKRFDLRVWKVETDQGPRQFVTEWDSFPKEKGDGSLILSDVGGDLYRIPPIDSMDGRSRRLLWSYMG